MTMRRILALLYLAGIVTPAIAMSAVAQDAPDRALADFAAYSLLLVANDNCPDLHLDPGKLKVGLERAGDTMGWLEYQRREEAASRVAIHTQQLRSDPNAFCASANTAMKAYEETGIRYR
jgi:hypothetical protein